MITAGERPGVTQSVAFEEVQEGAKCKVQSASHTTPVSAWNRAASSFEESCLLISPSFF